VPIAFRWKKKSLRRNRGTTSTRSCSAHPRSKQSDTTSRRPQRWLERNQLHGQTAPASRRAVLIQPRAVVRENAGVILGHTTPGKRGDETQTCGLVFPTSGCNPKQNFLDDLKACAERAKFKKEDFWLHKFSCYVSNQRHPCRRQPASRRCSNARWFGQPWVALRVQC
jgi:hypothetical protein